MEQRRPRLGDILDDYCPRERRLANHVVVALIGEEVAQTRCTTCDAEHAYKHAKVPPKRKVKEAPGVLVKPTADIAAERPRLNGDAAQLDEAPATVAAASTLFENAADTPESEAEESAAPEDGPVHRPLIRATLPRPEGEPKERPIPEFTMRAVRNARAFRPGGGKRVAGHGAGKARGQGGGGFRPGAMGSWSPSNPRPRGNEAAPAGRPRARGPHGPKKSR